MALPRNQIIGIAVAAVVGIAVFSGLEVMTGGGVERQLDRLEAEDPMVMAIATSFPAEWPDLRAQIVADAKSGMSVQQVTERAFIRSRAFMQERAPATAAASTPTLLEAVRGEAKLELSQPTVSRTIADLEKKLGAILVARTTRAVTLTSLAP